MFKKGVSGNPNGRPKGSSNKSTNLRKAFENAGRNLDSTVLGLIDHIIASDNVEVKLGLVKTLMQYGFKPPRIELDVTTDASDKEEYLRKLNDSVVLEN